MNRSYLRFKDDERVVLVQRCDGWHVSLERFNKRWKKRGKYSFVYPQNDFLGAVEMAIKFVRKVINAPV